MGVSAHARALAMQPPVEEVAAYRTGKNTLIRIFAEGPWSAIDMENLYEHIGQALRDGHYDKEPQP